MAKLYNLARMTTATTGTGTITLGSAVAGFLSFASGGIEDGDTVTYAIEDGANSEIGRGVYTSSGTTLTRSVLKSTNSNSAISLSGSAQVFITPAAEDFSAPDNVASVNGGPLAGMRNRLINGCMRINQRGSTTVADDTYCFDRWYVLSQTASITVGAQTNLEDTWSHAIRLTQSQASAQRMGLAQIIESQNCIDLRGQSVTLSARVKISASSQTLRYAILEWTGTADAVTSDWVNSWTNTTFTAGQFFTSTSTTVAGTGSTALTSATATTVSLTATISSSANNLAVMFWTDGTQAQNVTLDIGKVQLEHGRTASVFERRPISVEKLLTVRYYTTVAPGTFIAANGSGTITIAAPLQAAMRMTPSVGLSGTMSAVFPNVGTYTSSTAVSGIGVSDVLITFSQAGFTGSPAAAQGILSSSSYNLDAEL